MVFGLRKGQHWPEEATADALKDDLSDERGTWDQEWAKMRSVYQRRLISHQTTHLESGYAVPTSSAAAHTRQGGTHHYPKRYTQHNIHPRPPQQPHMLPHAAQIVSQNVRRSLGLCRRANALQLLQVLVFQVNDEGQVLLPGQRRDLCGLLRGVPLRSPIKRPASSPYAAGRCEIIWFWENVGLTGRWNVVRPRRAGPNVGRAPAGTSRGLPWGVSTEREERGGTYESSRTSSTCTSLLSR